MQVHRALMDLLEGAPVVDRADERAVVPQATQKLEVGFTPPIESHDRARKRLKKKLTGDLDMIILKALRKAADIGTL